MAQSPNAAATALGQGRFLVGTYLGLRDQRPRTKVYNDVETTYQGCDLGLRIDGDVVSVGFSDRPSAESFVKGWTVGDEVAVKVRILSGSNSNGPWTLFNVDGAPSTSTAGFAAPEAA